ncbi:MAG TPA: ABC transporter permease [Paenibacillus sp.]
MTFNNIVLNNILRDKWTYIAYFLSSVFSIFIFFSFSVSMFHPDLSIIANGSALSFAMMVGTIMVYLFSFMFISYSVMSFMRIRQKTLGLFVIMGASKRQIKKMVFRENMLIGIAAIVAALALGLVFAPLFLMVTRKAMQVEGFTMYFPIKAIILTLVMFFILFLLVSFFSPLFIRKQSIIQLLKSDMKTEAEVRFSPITLVLALIATGGTLLMMTFWYNTTFVRQISDNSLGVLSLFIIFVIGLYFLYMQLSMFVLKIVQKQNRYLQKTNMLTISGMKSQLRSNVKMMYLVSLLLMGTFFSIVGLYSANVNVEQNTKANNPFDYMYVSHTDNLHESEHVEMLQQSLKDQPGYTSYKYDVLYNDERGRQAIISLSNYNAAIQGLGGEPISLDKDEVYMISGLPKEKADLRVPDHIQKILQQANMTAHVVGGSSQSIIPAGYFNHIMVVSNQDYIVIERMQGLKLIHVFAYNVDNWKDDVATTRLLTDSIGHSDHGEFGFFSAGHLFAVDKNSKNLMFYVGFMLSLIFMIAALSMIYFRLITDLDKEREKYKGIMKIGLSKKELTSIVSRQLAVLMFVPFVVASLFFFTGVLFLREVVGGSLGTVTASCFVIFMTIQCLGYFIINAKYRNALVKELVQ